MPAKGLGEATGQDHFVDSTSNYSDATQDYVGHR